MLCSLSKPLRTVLWWQALATAALTLLGGLLAGLHGALSAALGGTVSMLAGLASGVLASSGRARLAGEVLFVALRAEGVKIGLIAALLWLVFTTYSEIVAPAFIGSFLTTVLVFSMAFFVRDN